MITARAIKDTNKKTVQLVSVHSTGAGAQSFSRASHFAMILIPSIFGVAYLLFGEFFGRSGTLGWSLLDENSLGFHLAVYALFLFGVGSAVFILRGLDELIDKERK
jgi:hypothetical protein